MDALRIPASAADVAGAVDERRDEARAFRARAARGSIWALVGHGGAQLLRLGGNLVLWRLLYAEAFGLMAIVNVFMQGLAMFSDIGIGPSIIQNRRGDERVFLDTAWTIQAMRGFALFGVAVVLAIPVANFYHQPELASLIPVVALGAILAGFNSTSLFTVTRQIALGRLTLVDLVSQAIGLAAMVVVALATKSIWALVVGGLVYNVARLALSHVVLPGPRNRVRWDRASATSLLHFGRWIFMSTLLTFAVMQSDRLIFGKIVPMSVLGVYSIATIWASFPSQILGHVFQSVLFPSLSRVQNERGDVAAAYRLGRAPWLIAAGWLSACLAAGGPALIRFLYDERAVEAGPIVQVLSIGAWFLALEMSNGSALLAQGKPKWVAAASAAKLAAMAVFIPLGFALRGFSGAIVGFAASEVLRYAVSLWGAMRAKLGGQRQDLALSAVLAVTTVVGLAASRGARWALADWGTGRWPALVEGSAIFVAVTAVWGVVFALHRRENAAATIGEGLGGS